MCRDAFRVLHGEQLCNHDAILAAQEIPEPAFLLDTLSLDALTFHCVDFDVLASRHFVEYNIHGK